jgi:hypothetical protein
MRGRLEMMRYGVIHAGFIHDFSKFKAVCGSKRAAERRLGDGRRCRRWIYLTPGADRKSGCDVYFVETD